MEPKIIGRRISEKRKRDGLSQSDLAQLLNVSNKTVSKWETGGGIPDLPLLVKLAQLFGMTVDDLIKDEQVVESQETMKLDSTEVNDIVPKVEKNNFIKSFFAKPMSKKNIVILSLICVLIVGLILFFSIFFTTGDYAHKTQTIDGVTYEFSDGSYYVTSYDGINSNIEIQSEVDGCSVVGIKQTAFKNNRTITSIVIPLSVIEIEPSSFAGCVSMEKMSIPFVGLSKEYQFNSSNSNFGAIFGPLSFDNSVMISQQYGKENNVEQSSNFYFPSTLKQVTVTGNEICRYAFAGCSNLSSIQLLNVSTIGAYAFMNCSGITSVKFSSTIEEIPMYAFYGCSALKFVTYSSSIKEIGISAFENCVELFDIYLPENLESIDSSAYKGCSNAWGIKTYGSLKTIGSFAFEGCTSLRSVIFAEGLEMIDSFAFSGCVSLQTLDLPDSLNTIESYVFTDCSRLTEIVVPDNVTILNNGVFSNCTSLISFTANNLTQIDSFAFSSCTSLDSFIIPNTITVMGDGVFVNCNASFTVYCQANSKPTGWSDNWNGRIEAYDSLQHKYTGGYSSYCNVNWGYSG